MLAGKALVAEEALRVTDSLPAGHAEAVLGAARRLGLARLLDRSPSKQRDLALAMICQRVLSPGSKLATARALHQSTLGAELGVKDADQDDLYAAMDWLLQRQAKIEDRLAKRHLKDGTLVLYDVSSSYFEGRTCPLAARGYSRDRRRGSLQVTYGLLCDPEGHPLATEAFAGNLLDQQTLPAQVQKLKQRFGLANVIVVCDRGMVSEVNLEALGEAEGVGWITALKAPAVAKLVKDGEPQLSLFDQQNLAEISSAAYPGERLVVCRNPLVGDGAQEKALRAARRHRGRAGGDRCAGQSRHPAGSGRDRPRRRPGAEALQGEKALRGGDHRRQLHLLRASRPRSRPRPHSTGSTSCARASPPESSPPPRSSAPTSS